MSDEDEAEELNTVKERVRFILAKYPYARSNDIYLWLMYVRVFNQELANYIKFIPPELIQNAPKPETLSRARRHIQYVEHEFQAPRDVRKRRRENEERYRQYYGRAARGEED